MNRASFRFYANLNDFIPAERRQIRFQHEFLGRPAVKDVLEALGTPHTEIDLILINDESTSFERRLADGDQVSVYPRFKQIDLRKLTNVRPPELGEIRFVLDTHLGRLAGYLRMLGFDSLYWNDADDQRIAEASATDGRIVLTRDRGLLKRKSVAYGYYVRRTDPRKQILEVMNRFDLRNSVHEFKRCIRCNGLVEPIAKVEVIQRLPARVAERQRDFRRCMDCEQVYWQGSHYERMQSLIESLTAVGGHSL